MIAQIDREYFDARPTRCYARLLSYLFFEGRPLLTKGRWINPLLRVLHSGLCRLPSPKSPAKHAFIVGTGRSGTTILGKVLSLHPEIGFLNEPKASWFAINKDDDLIGSYNRAPGRYLMNERDAALSKVRAQRLFGWYGFLARANCILDKYPEMVFRTNYLRMIFPGVRFVFLVRNGWDTICSIEKWSEGHGHDGEQGYADWWGKNDRKWHALVSEIVSQDPRLSQRGDELLRLTDQPSRAAVEWVQSMKAGRKIASEGGEVLEIAYEQLTADPVTVIRDIVQFLDLRPDEKTETYASEVLHQSKLRNPVELAPVVLPEFMRTMAEMGYT